MKSNYCTCIFYYADVFLYLTDSNQTEHLENPTNYFNGSAIDYDGSSSSSSSSFSSSFSSDFLIYLDNAANISNGTTSAPVISGREMTQIIWKCIGIIGTDYTFLLDRL